MKLRLLRFVISPKSAVVATEFKVNSIMWKTPKNWPPLEPSASSQEVFEVRAMCQEVHTFNTWKFTDLVILSPQLHKTGSCWFLKRCCETLVALSEPCFKNAPGEGCLGLRVILLEDVVTCSYSVLSREVLFSSYCLIFRSYSPRPCVY